MTFQIVDASKESNKFSETNYLGAIMSILLI